MGRSRGSIDLDESDSQSHSGNAQSDASSEDFQLISVFGGTDPSAVEASPCADGDKVLSFSRAMSKCGPASEIAVGCAQTSRQAERTEEDVGPDSEYLKQWVETCIAAQNENESSFLDVVRRNKTFRNPAIMEKMISYCGIDEFGSEAHCQEKLEKNDFYEAIIEFQEICAKISL